MTGAAWVKNFSRHATIQRTLNFSIPSVSESGIWINVQSQRGRQRQRQADKKAEHHGNVSKNKLVQQCCKSKHQQTVTQSAATRRLSSRPGQARQETVTATTTAAFLLGPPSSSSSSWPCLTRFVCRVPPYHCLERGFGGQQKLQQQQQWQWLKGASAAASEVAWKRGQVNGQIHLL